MKKAILIRLTGLPVMDPAHTLLARTFHREETEVIFITADKNFTEETVSAWLLSLGIPFDAIICRPKDAEAWTDQTEVELNQVSRLVKEGIPDKEIVFVIEQDLEVAAMWTLHDIDVFVQI